MKEEDVEVNGEINYSKELCKTNEEVQDKVTKELKAFMIDNKVVQIQVALVPKKVEKEESN